MQRLARIFLIGMLLFFSATSAAYPENTLVEKESFDECREFLSLFRSSTTMLGINEFPSRITKDFGLEFFFDEELKRVTIESVHPLYEYYAEGRDNWTLFGETVNEINVKTKDNFTELATALRITLKSTHLLLTMRLVSRLRVTKRLSLQTSGL